MVKTMKSEGVRRDVITYNTLIDLLAKESQSRCIFKARLVQINVLPLGNAISELDLKIDWLDIVLIMTVFAGDQHALLKDLGLLQS